MRTLLWPLIARSACAQPATVEAGTTHDNAPLAFVRLVSVVLSSHIGGRQDKWGRCSALFAWWASDQASTVVEARQVKALIRPVIAWSAWAQPTTVVAVTTGEGAAVASVHSVGVGSGKHYGSGQDGRGRCFRLCSLCRWGLNLSLLCRARQVRALVCPLLA